MSWSCLPATLLSVCGDLTVTIHILSSESPFVIHCGKYHSSFILCKTESQSLPARAYRRVDMDSPVACVPYTCQLVPEEEQPKAFRS